MKKWRCTVCGYVYDPEKGDPGQGVLSGTPFEGLPEDWVCPVCGVGRDLFEVVEGDTGAPVISDPKSMQSALFKISYGLFIVTSVKGERINGQIANTVFQITSEPMRVAVGINKSNLTHEFMQESGVLGITVLGQDGHDLVRRFGYSSGRERDKFAGLEYFRATTGVPIIRGGIAFLEGQILRDKSVDVGTHTLFIADVIDGAVIEDREPMTYAYFRKTK